MGDSERGMGSCFVGLSAETVGAEVVGTYADAETKEAASGLKKGWSSGGDELLTELLALLRLEEGVSWVRGIEESAGAGEK